MKRSRSSYQAVSPLSSEHRPQHPASEQYGTSDAQESYAEFLEGSLGLTEGLDSMQQILSSYSEPYKVQANTSTQPDTASNNVDIQRHYSQASQSLPQCSNSVLRAVANHGKYPGPIDASSETKRAHKHFLSTADASPYISHRRSYSATSQRSALTPMSNPTAIPAEISEVQSTPYNRYRSLFLDSDTARNHRHLSTRFGRQPYIAPEDDPTVEEVEGSRDLQVGRIYNAMICGDRAQDNPSSIAMKRWVHGAHYKSDLVEAFAHKVFDCLLVQVKEGFRGWHHNDYVDDDRKGEKEDREADCMDRLENIIDALEREKTICEDVVNSASQIRMFVNAPIAYAARKYQNRLGNSKRGRTKHNADSNPQPTKALRAGGRQNRARSTTVSEVPTSRDTTAQFQTPAAAVTPYFATPCSLQLQSSTSPAPLNLRQSSQRPVHFTSRGRNGHRQVTATAPPMTTRPDMPASVKPRPAMSPPIAPGSHVYNIYRTAMSPAQMLPAQQSPLLSTPLMQHHSYHSAPPSPDDAKYPVSVTATHFPSGWSTLDTLDNNICTPVDPLLTTDDPRLTQQAWSSEPAPIQATDASNYANHNCTATHVSLADIEYVPLQPAKNIVNDPVTEFESFWNGQPGVQQFSFDSSANDRLNRH